MGVAAAVAVGAAAAAPTLEEMFVDPIEDARRARNNAAQQVDDANRALREGTTSEEQKRRASFEAAARQRARAGASGGRGSTILTSPLGLPGDAGGRRKTLLGS